MSFSKNLATTVLAPIYNRRASHRLEALNNCEGESGKKFTQAITAVLRREISEDERLWVEQIENLRTRLNASDEEIEVIDFGAGDATETRSESEMATGVKTKIKLRTASSVSKPEFWAVMISKIIKAYHPHVCIELGTCVGVSGAYIAFQLLPDPTARLYTLEGAPTLAEISAKNFQELGLKNVEVIAGRFQDTLPVLLEKIGQVDFAFIDGHHEEAATINYFNQIKPYLAEQAVIIFDDIKWSEGMQNAWRQIIKDDWVKVAVNLRTIGLCLIQKDLTQHHQFTIPLLPLRSVLR